MPRLLSVFSLVAALVLAACAPTQPVRMGADGRPVPQVYNISDPDAVRFRMEDALNTMRQARGLPRVSLNASLNAAAERHARDMSRQERPWHFGSDGSSPLERVARAGYRGTMVGETVSETFENELQTLNAWMEDRVTRTVLTNPRARDIGLGFHQDPNGKLWWTLVLGDPRAEQRVPTS